MSLPRPGSPLFGSPPEGSAGGKRTGGLGGKGRETAADVAAGACRALRPDVALADLGLTEPLLGQLPGLAVVGLYDAGDECLVARAMRAGGRGCGDTWTDGAGLAPPREGGPEPAPGDPPRGRGAGDPPPPRARPAPARSAGGRGRAAAD